MLAVYGPAAAGACDAVDQALLLRAWARRRRWEAAVQAAANAAAIWGLLAEGLTAGGQAAGVPAGGARVAPARLLASMGARL